VVKSAALVAGSTTAPLWVTAISFAAFGMPSVLLSNANAVGDTV